MDNCKIKTPNIKNDYRYTQSSRKHSVYHKWGIYSDIMLLIFLFMLTARNRFFNSSSVASGSIWRTLKIITGLLRFFNNIHDTHKHTWKKTFHFMLTGFQISISNFGNICNIDLHLWMTAKWTHAAVIIENTEKCTYFKWIEIEVGRAGSEEPVNLLLGRQNRIPLLDLLHLNTRTKTPPQICLPLMLMLWFWFSAELDTGFRRKSGFTDKFIPKLDK